MSENWWESDDGDDLAAERAYDRLIRRYHKDQWQEDRDTGMELDEPPPFESEADEEDEA